MKAKQTVNIFSITVEKSLEGHKTESKDKFHGKYLRVDILLTT